MDLFGKLFALYLLTISPSLFSIQIVNHTDQIIRMVMQPLHEVLGETKDLESYSEFRNYIKKTPLFYEQEENKVLREFLIYRLPKQEFYDLKTSEMILIKKKLPSVEERQRYLGLKSLILAPFESHALTLPPPFTFTSYKLSYEGLSFSTFHLNKWTYFFASYTQKCFQEGETLDDKKFYFYGGQNRYQGEAWDAPSTYLGRMITAFFSPLFKWLYPFQSRGWLLSQSLSETIPKELSIFIQESPQNPCALILKAVS
jgi:hypothetical protein